MPHSPALLLLALGAALAAPAPAEDAPHSHRSTDLSRTLAQHYLWPWGPLLRAAAALDAAPPDEPRILSDAHSFQVDLNMASYLPEELRVRVRNRYVLVEGRHGACVGEYVRHVANNFMQRFALPAGCRDEEVTASLSGGVLRVSAPCREPPPPPPEREVPIVVLLPDAAAAPAAPATPPPPGPQTPLQQLQLAETHGKVRKKELKTARDNEVPARAAAGAAGAAGAEVDGNVLEE